MKFSFIDSVNSADENRIVAVKKVLPEDEYLKDHFPTFPIMPGVLMLETMVQAASELLSRGEERLVLGAVKSVKYGEMVRPNDELTVDIEVKKHNEDGSVTLKGVGTVKKHDSNETLTACSGRFTMRPATLN
ncbi:MAG: hypothetical protein MK073_00625 [Phycisphaerales bacterium]|nr:hypothetical protein [Phycisphaerales bacterium]